MSVVNVAVFKHRYLWFKVVAVLSLLSVGCVAQGITNPPQDTAVAEGEDVSFTCTAEDNGGSSLLVGWSFTPSGSSSAIPLLSGTTLTGIEMVTVSGGLRTMLTFSGVRREADGGTVQCVASGLTSNPAILTVQYPPQFSPSTATATPTEGGQLTLSFSIEASPPPTIDNVILNSSLVTDTRVTVTTTSLTIADVTRSDSGEYQITASNVAGSATFTLTVDVYYPPEFTVTSQNVTRSAASSEVFTFDCTLSGGNPAVYSYTFLKNNTVGTAVVTWNLFVVDVPTCHWTQ